MPDSSSNTNSDSNYSHDHVEQIVLPQGIVYLVATAHISKESVALARSVIERIRPQSVAVELCDARMRALRDPERWKKMDVVEAIRQGRGHLLLSQLLLAAFQKKLGAITEVRPGAEMLEGAAAAEEIGAHIILADRAIRTTLKRVWAHLGFLSAIKLLSAIVVGLISGERVKPEDIERLKQRDVLSAALEEFGQVFPDVERTLIAERDQYMAEKIRTAQQYPLVMVVGAGHLPGIARILREQIAVDLERLENIPTARSIGQVLRWMIPTMIIFFILLGLFRSGRETGSAMALSWVVATSTTAALGAIIALAHPLTILIATLVAPFTAVNPLLRSGWIAALVEATIRRPRVGDLEHILDDMGTIQGWYRNRVCRVLLVLIAVNVMGLVGGAVAVPLVARYVW